jgi:hypothetical protein
MVSFADGVLVPIPTLQVEVSGQVPVNWPNDRFEIDMVANISKVVLIFFFMLFFILRFIVDGVLMKLPLFVN